MHCLWCFTTHFMLLYARAKRVQGHDFTVVFPTHILLKGSGEGGPLEHPRCAGLLPAPAGGLTGSWDSCRDPQCPAVLQVPCIAKEGEHPTTMNRRLPAQLGGPPPPYRPWENPGTKPVQLKSLQVDNVRNFLSFSQSSSKHLPSHNPP